MNRYIYTFVAAAALLPLSSFAQQDETKQDSSYNTQAVSTIGAEVLEKNSTPETSDLLFGLLSGLNAKQRIGWTDVASLSIRGGGGPLIVVDGIPRSIHNVKPADIKSVSVLKDAAATAVWGTRGANGVILIETKRGMIQEHQIDVDYSYGVGLPQNMPTMANAYQYASAYNQALRNDKITTGLFSDGALELFKNGGGDQDLYPNVDWLGEALGDFTQTHQFDLGFSGGDEKVRYYSSINYLNEEGILSDKYTEQSGIFDSQLRKYDLSARINVDANITNTTLVKVSLYGALSENKRTPEGLNTVFDSFLSTPAGAFPIKTTNGEWGSSLNYTRNPIAEVADRGYFKTHVRELLADMAIEQDLSAVTEGLKVTARVSYDNSATLYDYGDSSYATETNQLVYNDTLGEYLKESTLVGKDELFKITNKELAGQYSRSTLSGGFNYDKVFAKNTINAYVGYLQEGYVTFGQDSHRYSQSILATVGYNYDERYYIDAVANYSGLSYLPEGSRFDVYPAVSVAWDLSNENFFENADAVNTLKLRASYGQVASESGLKYCMDSQYYNGAGSYAFGVGNKGVSSLHGSAPFIIGNIAPELSTKINIGLDAAFFENRLTASVDLFSDNRTSIMVDGGNYISDLVGYKGADTKIAIGENIYKGAELTAQWRNTTDYGLSYYVGGNVTYLQTEIVENGEGYQLYDNLYAGRYTDANGVEHSGNLIGQAYGYVAEGIFQSDAEVTDQRLGGVVSAGDIKYKDINGDGHIDSNDRTSIGYSTSIPAFSYGIQLGAEWKGFAIDAYFQGVGQYTTFLSNADVYRNPISGQNNVSTWYLEEQIPWTPETAATATMPALTTLDNANNNCNSTFWMVDGSYFKLRNVSISYTLPQRLLQGTCINKCQIYARGNNLFSFDSVPYFNCEDMSTDYVDMSEWYLGVNIVF